MATPADQRLLELLEKWLMSLELHLKYSSLDDDSYWKVQPWVEHQRPSRWILDLARQKTLALKRQLDERIESGDEKFADSLELMIFLANLVGSEHIERFIPVAEPQNERAGRPADATSITGTNEMPKPPETTGRHPIPQGLDSNTGRHAMPRGLDATGSHRAPKAVEITGSHPIPAPIRNTASRQVQRNTEATGTRQMPRLVEGTGTREMPRFAAEPPRTPAPVATPLVARNERRQAEAPRPMPKSASRSRARAPAPPVEDAELRRDLVIADAARLVQWGRKWYELPELIARMADRPPLSEVRRILKENKSVIDQKAGIP